MEEEEKSFAELFEAHSETPGRRFTPGDKVSGTVVKITKDTVFLDLGGKSEGYAEMAETSGVGVRAYYATLGYSRHGPYMVKPL